MKRKATTPEGVTTPEGGSGGRALCKDSSSGGSRISNKTCCDPVWSESKLGLCQKHQQQVDANRSRAKTTSKGKGRKVKEHQENKFHGKIKGADLTDFSSVLSILCDDDLKEDDVEGKDATPGTWRPISGSRREMPRDRWTPEFKELLDPLLDKAVDLFKQIVPDVADQQWEPPPSNGAPAASSASR